MNYMTIKEASEKMGRFGPSNKSMTVFPAL